MPEYPAGYVAPTAAEAPDTEADVANLTTDLASKLAKAANLSDVSSSATSRTNLGLGTAATHATGDFAQVANNLSDVTAATARTNLGLGTAATQASTAFAQTANNLSDVTAATARTNLGLAAVAASGSAADLSAGTLAAARFAAGTIANASLVTPPANWEPTDQGFLAWTFDPALPNASFSPGAAVLQVALIRVPKALTITNICTYIVTGGATITNCFAALYTSAGALIAQSADQSAAWVNIGLRTAPLTAPQSVAAGLYYAAWWVGTATTMPLWARNANVSQNVGLASPNLRFATANTSLTGATAPSNFTAQTASTAYWAAFS